MYASSTAAMTSVTLISRLTSSFLSSSVFMHQLSISRFNQRFDYPAPFRDHHNRRALALLAICAEPQADYFILRSAFGRECGPRLDGANGLCPVRHQRRVSKNPATATMAASVCGQEASSPSVTGLMGGRSR
ncbi:hypothetical protein RHECNPAF_730078 [Rhizobium etli CNPAF512]|nr:hypothetical protein RHECNPAF_730078 [Rhizobium etli CNPAF512]